MNLYYYKIDNISVYDGDTITCDIDLGFNVIMRKQKIRLYGIDTPEIRGFEREEGLKSKMALIGQINEAEVMYMKSHKDKSGKYGRWLGELYTDKMINLNNWLVQNGYAKEYMK